MSHHPAAPSAGAREEARAPLLEPGVLGMCIFLGTEAMFFAGLISAFLILRAGSGLWPPPGQPRLPVGVTGANTLILLSSGGTMWRALASVRKGRERSLTAWLAATAGLGIVFLSVQGYEWVRLLGFGLTLSSGTYGATFYALIGAHGLHVAAAVSALLLVLSRAARREYSLRRHQGVVLCRLYWTFVVGVWPVLYVLVYVR
ncbi:MAG: heme-copper oxidase subunit III [Acidobacteriota bacterium]